MPQRSSFRASLLVSLTAAFGFSFPRLQSSCFARCVPAEYLPGGFSCEPSDSLSLSLVSGNLIRFPLPEYDLWESPVTSAWQFHIFGVCQFWGLGNWWVPLLLCMVGASAYILERERLWITLEPVFSSSWGSAWKTSRKLLSMGNSVPY